MSRGREAIVDAEPREPGIRKRLEQRTHVGALAAFIEASAVDEDRGGERTGSIGDMQIEQHRFALRACILDVLEIERIRGQRGCRGEH